MKNSALYGANAIFVEELYRQFLKSPQSVDESWYPLFKGFGEVAPDKAVTVAPWQSDRSSIINTQQQVAPQKQVAQQVDAELIARSLIAVQMVMAYRQFGHTAIQYDPLEIKLIKPAPELSLEYYGLSEADLDSEVELNGMMGAGKISFRELLNLLKRKYARDLGYEFSHIEAQEERKWLQDCVENASINVNLEERKAALLDITSAEMFEEFLHKKFPGAKRFSLEGGEAMIASLNAMISGIAGLGGEEVILGMAHRGRLNVLTRVLGKSYTAMFSEFKGRSSFPKDLKVPGDVKYHFGASLDKVYADKKIHLSLLPNPSHLELVNSVALGKVRAKQDILKDNERSKVVGLLIHGDAAFAGQGSVPESLCLSQLNAYHTGGTIHLVINNQIGFTTNPTDSRSTRYCTEVAKVIGAPVIHVNGEDVDSVLVASKLAIEYRDKFKKDIVIDIICYRKYGHNEGDEPFFTQPVMYNTIAKHQSPRAKYAAQLLAEGVTNGEEYKGYQNEFHNNLEGALKDSESYMPKKADWLEGQWSAMKPYSKDKASSKTGVPIKLLKDTIVKISSVPQGFNVNGKIARQLQARLNVAQNDAEMDWGMGEALAMATLLQDGYNVRLSGQDCQRGTFSHRHAVLTDQETEKTYCPLQNLGHKSSFEVYNSNLSELAVMAFEYGYSISTPKTMVMWEGQFGDFANGAQMVIDQYFCSGEAKWLRMSGLVLLLPHGYEGQGPEHSSARLERFLQLCANDNMQVVNCTTPASFFHVLRRQMHREFRKPLVVMTPKSLLRHKLAVSPLLDLAEGSSFLPVLPEKNKISENKVRKLVLCSGKIFYDLWEKREELKVDDIAIVRLEQLYPFPKEEVLEQLEKYANAQVIWCQEEQKNMGAYSFIKPLIDELSSKSLTYVGRDESASTAAGYMAVHLEEQKAIIDAIFSK